MPRRRRRPMSRRAADAGRRSADRQSAPVYAGRDSPKRAPTGWHRRMSPRTISPELFPSATVCVVTRRRIVSGASATRIVVFVVVMMLFGIVRSRSPPVCNLLPSRRTSHCRQLPRWNLSPSARPTAPTPTTFQSPHRPQSTLAVKSAAVKRAQCHRRTRGSGHCCRNSPR